MINPGGSPLSLGKSIAKVLNFFPIPLKNVKLKEIDIVQNTDTLNNLAVTRKKISLKKASVLVRLVDFSKFVSTRVDWSHSNEKNLISVNEIPTGNRPKFTSEHKIPPTFNVNLGKFSTSSDANNSNCEKIGSHLYHHETEKAVNKQILVEFNACYCYLSMACYFARSDVALPGCQGYFMRMHEEEHGHALKLINYQTLRGASVKLYPIHAPEVQDWECIEKSLAVALDMEKLVKEDLMKVHAVASKHCDLSTMDLLESDFIPEQERSICEMARLLKRLTSMGTSGIAEYLFDKEMHKIFVKHANKKGIVVEPEKPEYYL